MSNTISEAEVRIRLNDSGLMAELKQAQASVNRTFKEISRERATPEIEIDKRQAEAAMAEIEAELKRLDKKRTKALIYVDVDGYAKATAQMEALEQKAESLERHYELNFRVDHRHPVKFLSTITGAMEKMWRTFKAKEFGNIPVHFFNLTLKLRQLAYVAAAALPAVMALGTSLVAVVGTAVLGLTGALAGLTAGLGMFLAGITGVGLVIAPFFGELGRARKATERYNDAVARHGKESTEAQSKLKQLRREMGNISPQAARAIASVGGLTDQWKRLTAAGRTPFFEAVGSTIQTVRANLRGFAAEAVESTQVLSLGWQDWMKQLRSPGARSVFKALADGFQEVTPLVMQGLANFTAVLGNIAVAAQPIFKHFALWFNNLTAGWRSSTGEAGALVNTMEMLDKAASSVGKVMGSTVKLLAAVFTAGNDSGMSLLDSFSATLDRWGQWIRTHPKAIQDWFKDMEQMTRKIIDVFVGLTTAATTFGVAVFEAFDLMLAPLAMFMGRASAVKTVVLALMAAFATRKIIAGLNLLKQYSAGLKTILGLQAASGAAGQMSLFSAGGGLAAGAGASAAALGAVAAAVAAVVGGFVLLNHLGNRQWRELAQDTKNYNAAVGRTVRLTDEVAAALEQQRGSLAALKDAQRAYNEERSRANLQALDAAQASAAQARQQAETKQNELLAASQAQLTHSKERLATATKAYSDAMKDGNLSGPSELRTLEAYGAAVREHEFALNRNFRSIINLKRAQQGLTPIVGQYGMQVGMVRKQLDGLKGAHHFTKFAAKADFSSVIHATRAFMKLQKLGGSSVGLKILANTSNPEQAVRRVQLLARSLARGRYLVSIGATDKATGVLSKAQLKALGLTKKQWKTMVTAEAKTDKINAFQRKLMGLKPRKVEVTAPGVPAAYNAVTALKGRIDALPSSKTVDIFVTTHESKVKTKARGGGANDGGMALIGEGRNPRELVLSNKTGEGFFTDGPMLYPLRDDQYVIPTDPSMRDRASSLMAKWARDMGLPAYKKGRKANDRAAKKFLKRKTHLLSDDLRPFESDYNSDKKSVDTQQEAIRRKEAENSLYARRNPDDFAGQKKNFTDLAGMYDHLEKLYSGWVDSIQKYLKKIPKLIKKWTDVRSNISKRKLSSSARSSLLSKVNQQLADLRQDRTSLLDDLKSAEAGGFDAGISRENAFVDAAEVGRGSADNSAIFEQANARADAASRAAGISEAAFRALAGTGDIGSGGRNALAAVMGHQTTRSMAPASAGGAFGGGVSINISALHPGDSRVLRALAGAVSQGISAQGPVQALSGSSGL